MDSCVVKKQWCFCFVSAEPYEAESSGCSRKGLSTHKFTLKPGLVKTTSIPQHHSPLPIPSALARRTGEEEHGDNLLLVITIIASINVLEIMTYIHLVSTPKQPVL